MPLVDRVHVAPTGNWSLDSATVQDVLRLRRELRRERYDVCVDLQGSVRSAAIGWMSGAPRLVGSEHPREWPARLLYRQRIAPKRVHVIDQAAELLAAGAGLHDMETRAPVFPIYYEAEERIEARVPEGGRVCLLAPTAGWGAKQWPAENFIALAKNLQRSGLKVWINAPPGGDPVSDFVAQGCGLEPSPCNLSERVALPRRAVLVIGGDTGPVHLAAALGRPVVALFGPTDPRRNGPWFPGARVTVLRNPASVVSHKRVAETEAGLARISVEEVFAAARTMLGDEMGHG